MNVLTDRESIQDTDLLDILTKGGVTTADLLGHIQWLRTESLELAEIILKLTESESDE